MALRIHDIELNEDMSFWGVYGSGSFKEVKTGDIIRHIRLDEKTVLNKLREVFPEVVIEPISAGTELYTMVGTDHSYVVEVTDGQGTYVEGTYEEGTYE